jgi:hypothetical protein
MQNGDGRNNDRNTAGEPELGLIKAKRSRKGPAERMWAPIKLKLDQDYNYVTKNWGLRFLYYFAMFVGMPFVYLYFRIKWKFQVTEGERKACQKEVGRDSRQPCP